MVTELNEAAESHGSLLMKGPRSVYNHFLVFETF